MSVKCYFCQKDISRLNEYEYLCSCGKNTCSIQCHEFVSVNYTDPKSVKDYVSEYNFTYYENICKDEILKNGKKGAISYNYIDYFGGSHTVATNDPDYQSILDELKQLRATVKKLTLKIDL